MCRRDVERGGTGHGPLPVPEDSGTTLYLSSSTLIVHFEAKRVETNGSQEIHGDAGKGTILRLESRCEQSGYGSAVQGIGTPRPDCKSGRHKALSVRNEQGGDIGAGREVRVRHERPVHLATRCASIRSLTQHPFNNPSYDLGWFRELAVDMRLSSSMLLNCAPSTETKDGLPFVT